MHYALKVENMTPEEKTVDAAPKPSEPPKEEEVEEKKEPGDKVEEKKVEEKGPEPYRDIKLFEGEVVKLKLNPHPFSFMHFYIHGILMLVFGVLFAALFFSSSWDTVADAVRGIAQSIGLGNGNIAVAFVVWGLFMIILALIVWKAVDDIGVWYMLLYIFILILAIAVEYFTKMDYRYLIPTYMILLAFMMLYLADRYRRAFRYYVTTMRIAIIKRFITHDEIFLRYRNIVDVDVHQGFWARVFGYGTIIPITPSGIGTGSDSITIAGDAEKGDLLEKGVREDRILSTTKSVATSRAKPDECLYGVKDPFGVKVLVSEAMDALSEDTQLREIRKLLKEQKEEKL
jgi:hypothetical protein